MEKKHLSELHNEHLEWTQKLNFVKDEILSFKNRLSEVVMANSKNAVLAPAEHFQNQFIRQNEVIDELLHEINQEEHKIVENAKANNIATDRRRAEENVELVEKMKSFDKIYEELKFEFQSYLAQVL